MNTSEAAAELGVTAKELRRFLRSDETFNNAGSGGRYDFSPSDMKALKKRFEKKAQISPRKAGRPAKDDEDSMSEEEAQKFLSRKRTRTEQQQINAAAEARVIALEEKLKSSGLHISQMA